MQPIFLFRCNKKCWFFVFLISLWQQLNEHIELQTMSMGQESFPFEQKIRMILNGILDFKGEHEPTVMFC